MTGGASQAARIRDWLCHQALPRWAPGESGFVECLTPAGNPDPDVPRRCVVQARQIYVYSHAAVLGLMPDGVTQARIGFDFLMRHGAPDGLANGFVHMLGRDGQTLDGTRDLYDHAFLLLAFSWFYRASGDPAALQAMESVLVVIAGLKQDFGPGYREDSTGSLPRRQNSHMHLLEAFLAAHAATGRDDLLAKAGAMVDLLERHFLRGAMLHEFFEEDFAPAPHPAGAVIEPGHHQEWVWLLQQYGLAAGRDMTPLMRRLYDCAMRHGVEETSGLVWSEIWSDGACKNAAKRLWPQTERLKAELALGLETAPTVERIFRNFLDPAPAGGWVDRLDEGNVPVEGPIPASTLYHIVLAFTEYLKT